MQTDTYVCLRNCTCPGDGGACALQKECGPRVEIHPTLRAGYSFWTLMFGALLGTAGFAAFIHHRGVPSWLPIRQRPFTSLYSELSDNDGL